MCHKPTFRKSKDCQHEPTVYADRLAQLRAISSAHAGIALAFMISLGRPWAPGVRICSRQASGLGHLAQRRVTDGRRFQRQRPAGPGLNRALGGSQRLSLRPEKYRRQCQNAEPMCVLRIERIELVKPA